MDEKKQLEKLLQFIRILSVGNSLFVLALAQEIQNLREGQPMSLTPEIFRVMMDENEAALGTIIGMTEVLALGISVNPDKLLSVSEIIDATKRRAAGLAQSARVEAAIGSESEKEPEKPKETMSDKAKDEIAELERLFGLEKNV